MSAVTAPDHDPDRRRRGPGLNSNGHRHPVDAVLCDRDGTLIVDVPYNGDPARVEPLPTVRDGLTRLRQAGIRVGVVSNQSGVARGDLTVEDVVAVMDRLDQVVGPFDMVLWCPHGPDDGCRCRKPAPGMIRRAARHLGVAVSRCAVVGDTGADVEAATAAGARSVLVPNARTRRAEVVAAPVVAPTFAAAVDHLLGRATASRATGCTGLGDHWDAVVP